MECMKLYTVVFDLDANICRNLCFDVSICRMYDKQKTEVFNWFSVYGVYFTAFSNKLQGFLTFSKSVAIHKIIESKKQQGLYSGSPCQIRFLENLSWKFQLFFVWEILVKFISFCFINKITLWWSVFSCYIIQIT